MLFSAILPLLAALCSTGVRGAVYPRSESWHGTGFLDGFRYPTEVYDNTTNGDVFWATPANNSLIYVNLQERVVLKVDNRSSVVYNEKRYAPKLYSKALYEIGTVWVLDAVHLPYGCSVWPAFWSVGAGPGVTWPGGGEIDIIEGINQQPTNQVALHAAGQCTATSAKQTGNTTLTDCNARVSSGCTVVAPDTNSYGAGFAAAGGGVYITEFARDGIRVWFYTRSAIPSSVAVDAGSIDTSQLGTPVAEYLSSSCDIATQFSAQQLILDITLCGDWAGVPSLMGQTCPPLTGTDTCYTKYVINDGTVTYANAYFEINYLNVYSASATASNTSGSSTSSLKATTTISAGAGVAAASSNIAASVSSRSAAQKGALSIFGTSGWAMMVLGLIGGGLFVL